jgi:hypothetical protein
VSLSDTLLEEHETIQDHGNVVCIATYNESLRRMGSDEIVEPWAVWWKAHAAQSCLPTRFAWLERPD